MSTPTTRRPRRGQQGPEGGRPPPRPSRRRLAELQRARRRFLVRAAFVAAAVLGGLFVVFLMTRSGGVDGAGGGPRFDVGEPGPGAQAPPILLPATTGDTFDLAAQQGKTVLLYFQEGVGCQPCWDQIRDIEANMADFEALGVDELVSIVGNPLDLLTQKAADEGISTPVVADPQLTLGESYQANQYGMMGTSAYGHTFILIGPNGRILWRADYGGAPDYTMYVGTADLLDDLRAGLDAAR